jgi:TorA maturation chaperone TorD
MSTPATRTSDVELVRLAAREHLLRFIALAASDPASRHFDHIFDPTLQDLACAAALHLATDLVTRPAKLAPGEEPPEGLDLVQLVEALDESRDRLVDDHTRVFGLVVSKECPPYEVQYCPQTFSVFRSQRMADIAGFYRAFGVEPGRDAPERVDHLACELEFLAWLVAKELHAREQQGDEWTERSETCRDAQRDFLAEHVAWWVPAFSRALGDRARSLDPLPRLQAALAPALAALIPAERAALGVKPPDELARPRPGEEEGMTEAACGSCTQAGA